MGTPNFAILAAAAAVAASPLETAMRESGGSLCFTRSYDSAWLKGHKGQNVREARLAIRASTTSGRPMLRLMVVGGGKPIYSYGECRWYDGDLNRGVQDNVLDESFKPTTGVGCHLYTDVDGGSAEEGGDFPVEWIDGGKVIQMHLPDSLAGWRSLDTSRNATFHDLRRADRIIRLSRAPNDACKDLLDRFAAGADMDDI